MSYILLKIIIIRRFIKVDTKKKNQVLKLTLAAMFMAIGLVLPFFTGQIPRIG